MNKESCLADISTTTVDYAPAFGPQTRIEAAASGHQSPMDTWFLAAMATANRLQAMCSSRSMNTEIPSLISTPSTPMGEARATAAALATRQATSHSPSRPQPTQPTNTDLATLPVGLPPVGTSNTDASAPEACAVDAATDNTTSYPSSNPREHHPTGEMTIATTNDQPKPNLTTSPMVLPPMASAVGAVARGAATTLDTWLLTTSPDAPAFSSTYETTTTSSVVGMSMALMSAICRPPSCGVASPHPAWGWSHLLYAVDSSMAGIIIP
jgi:hypothetical protein